MKKIASLLLLLGFVVMVVGCGGIPQPSTIHETQPDPNAYLCLTKEGYDSLVKDNYNAGYEDCIERFAKSGALCTHDMILDAKPWLTVQQFLASDNTSELTWGVVNCVDFSTRVNNNAKEKGIMCYMVLINAEDINGNPSHHVIVAFPTTDRGLVFVEPQSDKVVRCELGLNYYENFPMSPAAPSDVAIIKQIGIAK